MKSVLLALLISASAHHVALADETMQATHYGSSYNNQQMGCAPYNTYQSNDASIAAVGPSHYGIWPCGTVLEVSGPLGQIYVTRQDSCPRCDAYYPNMIDLSEAGHSIVCGIGTCNVTVRKVDAP